VLLNKIARAKELGRRLKDCTREENAWRKGIENRREKQPIELAFAPGAAWTEDLPAKTENRRPNRDPSERCKSSTGNQDRQQENENLGLD
jgi:hypothetical protein